MEDYKKLVCSVCGSDRIQILAWVDANNLEYICDEEAEKTTWCAECTNFVDFCHEDVYNFCH